MLLVCHIHFPLGSMRTAWFSVHSNIIQLLDKYSSQDFNGSLQGQQQTRSCNAKHLSQPLPASPCLPWSTTVSPCLSLRPLVYYCLHLPLPSPPLSVSHGLLMFPLASPCFHSVPHIPLALFGHQRLDACSCYCFSSESAAV